MIGGYHPGIGVTQKFQPHRKGGVFKVLTVNDSCFTPKCTCRRSDKHATIRLPTPDCSDPHTASADVFRRCALCHHWVRPIGKQNDKSLENPLFSPTTVHDVGLFSEGGRIALSQFGSTGQSVNQVNTCARA